LTQELLITASDAADRLALSASAVYRLLKRGALPSVKIGKSRRIRVADLEAFAERLAGENSPAL